MRARRAAKASGNSPGRPKRKRNIQAPDPVETPLPRAADPGAALFGALVEDSNALLEAVGSPKNRLKFMMALHQRTLQDFDNQRTTLDRLIKEAEEEGAIQDYKEFLKERINLTKSSSDYNLRMSKELQVFQELAAKEDSETPITFVHVGLPPREWVEVPALGDEMDFSSYLPTKATDRPEPSNRG